MQSSVILNGDFQIVDALGRSRMVNTRFRYRVDHNTKRHHVKNHNANRYNAQRPSTQNHMRALGSVVAHDQVLLMTADYFVL